MEEVVFSDRPINSSLEDKLGYDDFAARLVKPLGEWPTEQSLVAGLYGSWGYGKPCVLNLLYGRLRDPGRDNAQAIPIRFNTWLYGDTESLLLSFFGTLPLSE